MQWRPSQATVLIVTIAAGLVGNLAANTVKVEASWWTPVSWVALAALVILDVVLETRRSRVGPSATGSWRDAEQRLALAVKQQWVDRAVRRGLFDAPPLRVTFVAARRGPVPHPADILGDESLRPVSDVWLNLKGDVAEIAARFRQIPRRRLVVLGEAGAGKTVMAMLLTKDLLETRDDAEPVPVLLSLTTWLPGGTGDRDEHLHTWLARRLVEEYPFLADTGRYGADVAGELLARHRILPVLDGLDELSPGLRVAALQGINRALAEAGASLVLTCRTAEYEKAVEESDRPLTRAAVIELKPLSLEAASDFLTCGTATGQARWADVLAAMERDPGGPVGQVLVTPLAVGLAQTLYDRAYKSQRDPQELLDLPDGRAVWSHLLAGFVDSAYMRRPTVGLSPRQWRPDRARRWLIFLAEHLANRSTTEFAWWRLRDDVPVPVRVSLVVLCCGVVAASGFAPHVALLFALVFGLVTGLPAEGPPPRRVRVSLRPDRRQRPVSALIGVALGLVAGIVTHTLAGLVIGVVGGLVVGMTAGSFRVLAADDSSTDPIGPVESLHADRGAVIRVGVVNGLVFGIAAGIALAAFTDAVDPVAAAGAGVVFGVLCFFGPGTAFVAMFGALAGLLLAEPVRFEYGGWWGVVVLVTINALLVAVVLLAATSEGGVGMSAWTQWLLVSRIWYPLTRRLPWAINAFIVDAHERGILRQFGSTYQFRHELLQEHLASSRMSGLLPEVG